jgi:tetratricopeptide (TPR) repeat protein
MMDAHGGSANVPVDALGGREAKTVAAARVLSIDYEPIIEDTVAGLAHNTSDKRGKIYGHARSLVIRHLQLMWIPEPIIELEKLALDLAIGKIERRWQAREAAEKKPAEGEVPLNLPDPRIERPMIATISIAARPRRRLASPIGVAVALPVIAAMISFGLYVDRDVSYRRAVYDVVGRWLPDPGGKAGVTARIAAKDAAPDRGAGRDAPIRAAFAAEPKALAPTICGDESSMFERNICTHETSGRGIAVETPNAETAPPWLESFTAFTDMTSGRAPSNPLDIPVAAEEVAAAGAEQYGAPVRNEALMPPDAVPRAATPQELRSGVMRPINAKVAALMESGKRAALKGDLDRAVRDFGEAIRIDPKYPDSYSERGQAFFKLGEIERAIADYSAAIVHDPQHGAALRARGMAYLYRGETDLALADLSHAIELAEHDPRLLAPIELFYARRSRASIYDSKQQYDLEIADTTALIESYAHDAMLAEALTANYGSAGAANILAIVHRQRANAFVRRSNVERAMADLTDAIPLSLDNGYAALIDRSKLHEGLGRRDLAAADARAALNIRPSSEEARLALGRLTAFSNPTPPKGL